MRILLVDRDARLARALKRQLARDAFDVDPVASMTEASQQLAGRRYDLVVADPVGPDGAGLALLREWRASGLRTPVLLISRRRRVRDRVAGLDAGADDVLIKPFAPTEFAARVRALLRRNGAAALHRLVVSDLSLDPVTHKVYRGQRRVRLTPMEFAVLEFLMRHGGRPVSRAQISQAVWGVPWDGATNVIDVFVSRLRRKLDGTEGRGLLHPVRGIGYVIGPDPE